MIRWGFRSSRCLDLQIRWGCCFQSVFREQPVGKRTENKFAKQQSQHTIRNELKSPVGDGRNRGYGVGDEPFLSFLTVAADSKMARKPIPEAGVTPKAGNYFSLSIPEAGVTLEAGN